MGRRETFWKEMKNEKTNGKVKVWADGTKKGKDRRKEEKGIRKDRYVYIEQSNMWQKDENCVESIITLIKATAEYIISAQIR